MILKLIADKNLAAEVTLSLHDDCGVLIPLDKKTQAAWSKRAKSNRHKILNPALN